MKTRIVRWVSLNLSAECDDISEENFSPRFKLLLRNQLL